MDIKNQAGHGAVLLRVPFCLVGSTGFSVAAAGSDVNYTDVLFISTLTARRSKTPPFFPYSCKGLRGVLLFIIV